MMKGMVFASRDAAIGLTTGSWAARFFSASRVRRTSSLLRRLRSAFSFSVCASRRIRRCKGCGRLLFDGELVHADDDLFLGFDRALELVEASAISFCG
jgi:hypothetical protein